LNWITALTVILFHVGAVAALFMFNWRAFLVALFLYWMATGLGISMGYHRLHTHRGYKCPLWLEYFFAICGTLTLEGGPLFWVAVHRVHHQNSDQHGDPHSPRDGVFWSHMGWIMFGDGNHNNTKLMSKYCPDLAKHWFYRVLNTWHWVPMVVLAAILFAIGGLPMMFWGIFVRVVFGLHATWLVNSATHLWGGRRFATRDDSRNSWWVALLTFGEGWHNNHHANPTSVRHGLAWYEVDHSWILANILERVGLIWDLKIASLPNPLADREAA
jgi:stearoyl-CoA desaturase (delta-9 desaturase)